MSNILPESLTSLLNKHKCLYSKLLHSMIEDPNDGNENPRLTQPAIVQINSKDSPFLHCYPIRCHSS